MKHFIFWILVLVITAPLYAAPSGFLEGHLTIVSDKGAEVTDQTQESSMNYGDFPLIVLDGKKQITRFTADGHGNYRVALPPGKYVLDAEGRTRGHLRLKPQSFEVSSNHTVRVNMQIDTGAR